MARRHGIAVVMMVALAVARSGAARRSEPGAVALASSTRQARIHQLASEEKDDEAGKAAAADFAESPASPRLQDQWWYQVLLCARCTRPLRFI